MEQRSFGGRVRVSALGIGCGRVGSISNPVSMREVGATLEAAMDAGVNLFDTADVYGQGDSERLLGRLRARYGDQMFVVTKVGLIHGRLANAVQFAKPMLRALARSCARTRHTASQVRNQAICCDFTPVYLRQAVEGSLRRLRVSALDGLLLHNPTPGVLVDPQIHELLHAFVQEGKAINVGISANSVQDVATALSIPDITMVQVPLTVAEALTESLSKRLHQRGIALFVREVLRAPHFGSSYSPRQKLASALRHQSVTAAIVGVSTRSHLKELLPVMQ